MNTTACSPAKRSKPGMRAGLDHIELWDALSLEEGDLGKGT